MKKIALLLLTTVTLTAVILQPLAAQENSVTADIAQSEAEGKAPKVALVLSGGAALGFAHLGFLKVLEEVGIPIDYIVGNSMGSLIGGMYAAGYSPGDIERHSLEVNWGEVFLNEGAVRNAAILGDPAPLLHLNFDKSGVGKSKGILPDQNLTLLFSRLMYRVSMIGDFAALDVPFKVTAVDLAGGGEVPLDHGVLYRAMRASMSIPLIFPPVAMNNTYLVDGALLNNNPIDLARQWGADIIIDIDVGSVVARKPGEINSIEKVADQTIRFIQNTNYTSNLAVGEDDFILFMNLSDYYLTDFAKAQEIIDRGEEITRSEENMNALLRLAAKIETKRPLVKRDWRRAGVYMDIPEPFFTQVRLVSINADAAEESRQTRDERIPPKFLNSLFDDYFGKTADKDKLEAMVEIVRRRGNYESVGYHLEEGADGAYCLVLTGVRSADRENDVTFTLTAALSFGSAYEFGIMPSVDLNFKDLLLRNSRLSLKVSYAGSRTGGPSLLLGYTKDLSSLFQVRTGAAADYLTSTISAFQPDGKLSTLGNLKAGMQFSYTPADYFDISLGYRFDQIWYQNKEYDTVTRSAANTDSLIGNLHLVQARLHFNTLNIDRLLPFNFLHDLEFDARIDFPFAGTRLESGPVSPWYERFEILFRKAWSPHPRRSFSGDLNIGSYRGDLDPQWGFYSLSGKAGIPGYAGMGVLGRDKGIAGFTWLEEIPPLSNLLRTRSFFTLTLRGGNAWDEFTGIERLKEFRGGVRTGLQIETPIGMLFLGPEVSFDGKFQFSLYFN
ncbi:hypothetical protein FACS189476_05230 [Spirochaetia bacterium]|nr:hypothetical protein FACS189476_05230 [Spirochaetia bacterium]